MDNIVLQDDHKGDAALTEFTTSEAARFLGCSAGYLMKARQIGYGPAFQRRWKRRGIFYLRRDLEEWRRGRRYLSTSDC